MSAPPATQVRTFHLDAPLARVFPMFTPLGERAWAKGWEPMMLSGMEERGTVFRTEGHRAPGSSPIVSTWVVTDYRPSEARVSYARLAQDSNIGLVDVICSEPPGGGTDVSVRYTLTAVSESGESFVREFLDPHHYTQMIDEWRTAISAALTSPAASK